MANKEDIFLAEKDPLTDSMTEGSVTMQTSVSQNNVLAPDKVKSKENKCWKKVKRVFKVLYSYIRSIIGLLFLLTVYSFIGAFIFKAIEGPYEIKQKEKIVTKREEMIELIVNYTHDIRVMNESHLTNKMAMLLKDYESEIYEAYKTGVVTTTSKPKWDFFSALFYSGTVYTTIGYGHIAPSTTLGQVITIIYAFIGIPLALITLADLGKRFTFAIKFVLAFLSQIAKTKCCRRARGDKRNYNVEEATTGKVANGTEVRPGVKIYFGYEVDTEFNLNFFLALSIVVVYILLGAGIYTRWEDWTYFEAVYFIFISISTIGFGDVIPAHPKFFLLSSVYVFIGLSLVSMCINVAMVFFSKQIDKAKVNIERATEKAMERTNRTIHLARGKMHEMGTKMNQFHHNHSFHNHHNNHLQDSNHKNHDNHHNSFNLGHRFSIHNLHKSQRNGRGFKLMKRNSF